MNTTRIEVPLTLPPPHFDDDATLATARQVVPIKGARRTQWRRRARGLTPLLLASTFCGALGAAAVNYYERRREVSATTMQQPATNAPTQTNPDVSPAKPAAELPANQTEIAATVELQDAKPTSADEPRATNGESKTDRHEAETKSPATAAKSETNIEAAKLIRKRRVQAPEPEIPIKKKGAAGIEDLFSGRNP